MCGQCAVDYAHTAPFVCRKCGSRGVTGFFYFLFMAWWVAFLLFTTWKARRKAMANNATLPPHIKVLVTHLQFLGMAGLVRCGWDSSLEQFFALARATVLPTEAPVSLECVIAGNTVDSSGTVAYDAVRASLLLPCRVLCTLPRPACAVDNDIGWLADRRHLHRAGACVGGFDVVLGSGFGHAVVVP